MKLVTFIVPDGPDGLDRLGAHIAEDRIVDLAAAVGGPAFASMQALIEAGPGALDEARAIVAEPPQQAIRAVADIRLRAPLPLPIQMRDFLSFELHLKQAFANAIKVRTADAPDPEKAAAELRATGRFSVPDVWYRHPIYYKCNRFAISGPEDEVVWAAYSKIMDYELELAAVIGRKGRDIAKEAAGDYIFGYTIFNDFSARDAQMDEMEGMLGPAKGKDFDGSNAIGPCLVTADEIGDPYNLDMVARVNGEEWSRGHSGTMHWSFADMIAHVSRSETLYPGEILGSGTVGNGCGVELMKFLQDGDVVELEIEGIGVLRNRVVRARA